MTIVDREQQILRVSPQGVHGEPESALVSALRTAAASQSQNRFRKRITTRRSNGFFTGNRSQETSSLRVLSSGSGEVVRSDC